MRAVTFGAQLWGDSLCKKEGMCSSGAAGTKYLLDTADDAAWQGKKGGGR
jgi:hypothetical protein